MKILKRIIFILVIIILATVYSYGVWPRAIYNTSIGSSAYEVTESLNGRKVLEQEFMCEDKGLCGITIKLTKQTNRSIGTYDWTIVEKETGETVGEGIIDESTTENKEFESKSSQKQGNVNLEISKQKESKNKEYLLTITPHDVSDDESMAIYITEKGNVNGNLTINGVEMEKASVIKIQYQRFNTETFIVFLGVILYLVVFVKFMYRLFK